ncbi:hypothetical protein BDV12DRAFT_82272 [Aspergillus spectabilis]
MILVFLALATVLGLVGAFGNPADSLSSVNQSTWGSFQQGVGGRLYDGEPMLAPCFVPYNGQLQAPDTQECNVLQRDRNDSRFVSGNFGTYHSINWGVRQAIGEGCAFGSSSPDLISPVTQQSYQGSYPSKYVDAQSVDDIQKTLNFTRTNHLRLVIKNTGHDYTGRNSGRDSLALWTHNIQPLMVLGRGFIPDRWSEGVGDAITFGAGQQFAGIYEFAHEHDYRVVGGFSNTVGAAGG